MQDELETVLSRMIALAPGDGRINSVVWQVCGDTLSLPSLPASVAVSEPSSAVESVVAEFAGQFSVAVSAIDDELRQAGFGAGRVRLSHCRFDVRRPLRASGARASRHSICRFRGPPIRPRGTIAPIRPTCERYLIDAEGQTVFA